MKFMYKTMASMALAGTVAALALTSQAPSGADPDGTRVTAAVRPAAGPAAERAARQAAGTRVTVWASNVRLHTGPHINDPSPTTFGPGDLIASCQMKGDRVTDPAGTSEWWSFVSLPSGSDELFISNVFLKGGEKMDGVPDC
jgi:hypothetical protein